MAPRVKAPRVMFPVSKEKWKMELGEYLGEGVTGKRRRADMGL